MAAPRILPQGFIDRTIDDGAMIMLTSPRDSHSLHLRFPETRLPSARRLPTHPM